MSSTINKIGGLLVGAFAVDKIFDFGKASVDAFSKAQAQMAIFDNNIKNTRGSTDKARDAMLGAANAAIKLGFDDEQTALSMSKFYQRTGDVTEAIKLNSVAMDFARARNIDFGTASNIVSQVLAGNGRILKQYGINIKDATSPLEALNELQKQISGSATAASKTYQVQAQVLAISWENIQEIIGGALTDALLPFITELTTWLNDPKNVEQIKAIAAQFTEWGKVAIPIVIDAIKILFDWVQKVVDVMTKVGDVIIGTFVNVQKAGNIVGNAGKAVLNSVGIGTRASGGPVSSGIPYLVGEGGPELFMPSSSGSIIPNMGASGGGFGGSGGNINVYLSGTFYTEQQAGEKLGNQIARILGQQLKLKTR